MTGYIIAQVNLKKKDGFKDYANKVPETVKKYGGEYLVRAGEFKSLEGKWDFTRNVIIKFPSYERALEWYNSEEYKPIKQIRLDNAEGTNIIIKGL